MKKELKFAKNRTQIIKKQQITIKPQLKKMITLLKSGGVCALSITLNFMFLSLFDSPISDSL